MQNKQLEDRLKQLGFEYKTKISMVFSDSFQTLTVYDDPEFVILIESSDKDYDTFCLDSEEEVIAKVKLLLSNRRENHDGVQV